MMTSRLPKTALALLMGLAFALPLAVNPLGYDIHDLPKLALFRVTMLGIGGLLAYSWLSTRQVRRTLLDIPVVFLLLAGLLAALGAAHRPTAFYGAFDRYEGWISLLGEVALFFSVTMFVTKRQAAERVLRVVIASSGVVAAYAVLQHFGFDLFLVNPDFVDRARSWSTFGNPAFLGAYLTLVLPLAAVALLESDPSPWRRFLAADVVVLSAALAFTGTRGAWIGSGVAVLVVGWGYLRLGGDRRASVATVALLVAAGLSLGLLGEPGRSAVSERLQPTSQAASLKSRTAIWDVSLSMVKDRPLLGYGPDNFRYAFLQHKPERWLKTSGGEKAVVDKAHNETLQWAATGGMMGLLAFLWLFIAAVWSAARMLGPSTSRQRVQVALFSALLGSIVGYLVQLQASFSVVSVGPLLWLLLGILGTALPSTRGVRVATDGLLGQRKRRRVRILIWGYVALAAAAALWVVQPLGADYHFAQGLDFKDTRDWKRAATEMAAATRANTGAEWYWIGLGQVLMPQADVGGSAPLADRAAAAQQASDAFSRAILANPTEPEGYWGLAAAQELLGRISGEDIGGNVRAAYMKGLEVDPQSTRGHFELGIAESSRGKLRPAIGEWEKVVRVDALDVEAHYNLARAYELTKEWGPALREYRAVQALSPSDRGARDAVKRLEARSR